MIIILCVSIVRVWDALKFIQFKKFDVTYITCTVAQDVWKILINY